MDELVELAAVGRRGPVMVSTMLTTYSSPLKWRDWDDCLANHPDRRFAANITNGIREGFRIGYGLSVPVKCKKATSNMYSATDHPEVIREHIAKECA